MSIVYLEKYYTGQNNWADAFEAAIASLPKASYVGRDNTRPAGGNTIYGPDAPMLFDRTVMLPADVLFDFYSTRQEIRTAPGVPYAFQFQRGIWTYKSFNNVFLHGCSIAYEAQVRGQIEFNKVSFDSTVVPCHDTLGEGVVGVKIWGGGANRCAGFVSVNYRQSDNWIIGGGATSVRSKRTDIYSASSGVHVEKVFFENRDKDTPDANDYPYVWFEGTDGTPFYGGQCSVRGARFGSEIGTGNGPPTEVIRLGSVIPNTHAMSGISLTDCLFNGKQGEEPRHARNAMRFTQPQNKMFVCGNIFNRHGGPLVQEDYLPSTNIRDNIWCNVVDSNLHTAGIFSSGPAPKGWKIL